MKKSVILSFFLALFLTGSNVFASTGIENSGITADKLSIIENKVIDNTTEEDVTCINVNVWVMDCDGWTTGITLRGCGSNYAAAGAAVDEQIRKMEAGGNSVWEDNQE